ncbi:MAG: CRTAC1 family protein [Candidatus Acidiferrum sp.]
MRRRQNPDGSRFTRREMLSIIAASAVSGALPGALRALPGADPFERIPAATSQITWTHSNGHSPEKYLPETTGAGCAFFDYDNDGWMDVYLVNSGKCDFFNPDPPLRNALYKNNRDGTFTDVTEKAGVGAGGFGQGVAVGDYDRDGFQDLYITQYGRSILYHNNGDGTFTDVTERAGVGVTGWASSAVWFDYDNDGLLDLFVGQFVDFSKEKNKPCGVHEDGLRHYCIPQIYQPMPSWLFHNNGDGTFTDVSKSSGIVSHPGKVWGVVACDVNNDGRMDLFVSNDTVANFLFVNDGKGKFSETGTEAGVAFGATGKARSGMGVDAADFNQDGWLDLFVANIDRENFALYQNNHDGTFDDLSAPAGVAKATKFMSGWGLKFFDYDNDGDIDLLLSNGNPDDLINALHGEVSYEEPLILFHRNGKAWEDVSVKSGPVFMTPMSARGLALGDFDNDGAVDVLISVNGGAPVLLHNLAGKQNHWLGIQLVGTKSNVDAIGAEIKYKAGDLVRTRTKVGGGSYLSSHDPRVVLGLGKHTTIDWVEVKWPQPGGASQRFTGLPVDRYIKIVEGEQKWR